MSEKRTQTHDDMNIPCSNTHESPNQVPSSAGIDERKISYISRALDRTCARFDLEYFMSTNDGITAISSLLSSQIVDLDDVVIRTAYKSERVAFIINALIRSTRFRCEGYCSVGTLYREACLASTPKTYFAEFTNRALYLDETEGDIRNAEWNTMVKVIRRAQDVAQEDFGALAEEIAQYLYTLLDEDCFNQLKTSIYKRFTPVNVRREQNVADDKELRAS